MWRFIKNTLYNYALIIKELFTPDEICESIDEIILASLYQKGYRTLLLDVDNTLLPYSQRRLSLEKINWITKCKNIGFQVFLVSNNLNYKRLHKIAEQIEVPRGIYFALKPFSFGVRDLASRYSIDLKKTVVIGDQLFTDVLMGNWLRCYTILVDPINKNLSFLKTLQREIELALLRLITRIE